MKTNPFTIFYTIPHVPDKAFSQYLSIANGYDVRSAVGAGFEHFMRTLSQMPPQSVSSELIYVFTPQRDGSDRQSRLKLYLSLAACEQGVLDSLDQLVNGGLLSRFYKFDAVSDRVIMEQQHGFTCSLLRCEQFVQPLHDVHFNYKIPACYYTVSSFIANRKNDYLSLDKVLDLLDEQVVIRIGIQPEDISLQLHAHTGYLARLQGINRSWDDQYDDSDCLDFLEPDDCKYRHFHNNIKPFQRKDPLADDILRQQRRFHESLRQAHLSFRIKIQAETQSTARLIGSVVAESAFEKGCYRLLLDKNEGDKTNSKKKTAQKPVGTHLRDCLHLRVSIFILILET